MFVSSTGLQAKADPLLMANTFLLHLLGVF